MSDLPRALLCSFDVIPGPTGSSRRLTEYLRELSEHFSVVVLSAKTPDHSHIQRFHGARLLRVPVGSGDLPSRVQAFDRAVRRQLDSEEYVVAHFTDPFGGYALCELRETYGYRLIYEAHGFPSQELASQDPQMESDRRFLARARRQELFCLMNADRVITGSEVTRAFIHGLGVSEDIVDVLRAPVDVAAISAETGTEPVGSPMRVLYLGSQVEWQGLPTLLRAVKQVLREVELQLTIAGPAHVREQPLLEDLIRDLGIGRNVVLQPPPPPEELPRLLGSADVGVVPLIDVHRNRVQGGPLTKVAEYLAAGRPVLASDLPVTRELIPSGAGLFHPPGNVDALAANLIRLARAPQSRVQMGAAARKAARAFHDATAIRRRLAGIYSRLLGTVREDTSASGAEPFPPAMRAALKSTTDADIEGTDPAIAPRLLATGEQNGPQEPGTSSTEPSAKSPDDVVRVVALSPLLPLPGDAPESTSTEVLPPPPMPPVPSSIPTNRSDHLIGRRGAEPEASSTPIVGPPSTPGTPTRSTVPTFIPRRIPPGRPTTLIPVTPPVLSPPAVPSSETPAPPAPTRVTLPTLPTPTPATPPPLVPPQADTPSAKVATPRTGTPAARTTATATGVPTVQMPAVPRTPTPPPLTSVSPTLPATPPPLPSPVTPPALPTQRPPPRADASNSAGPTEAGARSPATLTIEPPSLSITPPPLPSPLGRLAEPPRPEDAEAVEVAAEEVEPADEEPDGPVEVSSVVLLETIDPEGSLTAEDALTAPAPAAEPALAVADDAVLEHVEASGPPPDVPSTETIPSNLDPWFAQLVHGYCPPEGAQFARPTPPTNFPGREGPPPPTVQPTAPISQSFPTRSGGG